MTVGGTDLFSLGTAFRPLATKRRVQVKSLNIYRECKAKLKGPDSPASKRTRAKGTAGQTEWVLVATFSGRPVRQPTDSTNISM